MGGRFLRGVRSWCFANRKRTSGVRPQSPARSRVFSDRMQHATGTKCDSRHPGTRARQKTQTEVAALTASPLNSGYAPHTCYSETSYQIREVGELRLAEVHIQDGESLESALRRFKRKVQTEDIIKEIKRHSFYLKPGEKKRTKEALARKRNRKKRTRDTE